MCCQKQPAWLSQAVFYEIYPQSFLDTDSDGIGNFEGIIQKLDYIKSIGCNALWLNPCFDSPFGDAGYDVRDYRRAAPRYGTNDDLKRLFDTAHEKGLHVLLDLVPGHTSVEHPWFIKSMEAEQNEYTDRYIWTDNVWEAPTDLGCIRGMSRRNGCAAVNFFSSQPALNYGYEHPEKPWQQGMDAPGPRATLAEMMDIMRFWLGMGCDGFRVDMAGSLVKGDPGHTGILRLWQEVRTFLDREFPDAAIISEWGEPDLSLQAGFHMDFLLHFGPSHYNDLFRSEHAYFSGDEQGDASLFIARYNECMKKSGGKGLMCIPSGNHDMDRLARGIPDEAHRKLAFLFLLTVPGAPFIYYGDEIGMRYVENLTSVEGGYERTGSRSPMQWDRTPNSGFSRAPKETLYIAQDPDPDRPTVEKAEADTSSLLWEIRRLLAVRSACPALGNLAGIRFLTEEKNTYPLAYLRYTDEERLLVLINPSDREQCFSCGETLSSTVFTLFSGVSQQDGVIRVPACSGGVYRLKQKR